MLTLDGQEGSRAERRHSKVRKGAADDPLVPAARSILMLRTRCLGAATAV